VAARLARLRFFLADCDPYDLEKQLFCHDPFLLRDHGHFLRPSWQYFHFASHRCFLHTRHKQGCGAGSLVVTAVHRDQTLWVT
jgi:hypothetical protein